MKSVTMLRAIATTLPFRALVAFFVLYAHLRAVTTLAKERFDIEWQSPIASEPRFLTTESPRPTDWDRLVVSRWDSQHYLELALRGYSKCKRIDEMRPDEFPSDDGRCQLNFYPTYGVIGRYVARLTGFAIDYAMLLVSIVASFAFLMMWTSDVIVRGLGLGATYLSLLLFNTFTWSFSLVTIQTEPLFLALLLGTFYCFARRWLLAAALVAGAATAVRISGVGASLAYGVGVLALTLQERPSKAVWIQRALYVLLSAWGVAALMFFFHHRFGDAFAYEHAHSREYHHGISLDAILVPDTRVLMKSIWAEPHDGIILAACLLWFALGHRKGLERFSLPDQAFWYGLFAGVVGVSMLGSSDVGYLGMSRYVLGALPLFFAMAGIMKRRPVVLGIWLYMSLAHYWSGSLCFYVGQNNPNRFGACGFARSFVNE